MKNKKIAQWIFGLLSGATFASAVAAVCGFGVLITTSTYNELAGPVFETGSLENFVVHAFAALILFSTATGIASTQIDGR